MPAPVLDRPRARSATQLRRVEPGPRPAASRWRLLWADRRVAAAVTVLVAGPSGWLMGVAMPFGPVTTGQLVAAMGAGLGVGLAAGFVLRSRWAMLLAPVVHIAAMELARRGLDVPTVDRIDASAWGVLVFVLGRGVYGLLVIGPMLLGVAYGVALARRVLRERRSGGPVAVWARRVFCGLAAAAFAAILLLALRPVSVPPVRDAQGDVVPGSIAVLEKVRLGGHDQWIEIRGADPRNPVLLYLSGGPGQSDLPFSRVLLSDLTARFTVVGWDQRGSGKSYRGLDPETLTLDGMVSDTIALTTKLQQRFGDRPVFLLGESWGSTLAVLAAQRRPDLYTAVVSSGQMVSPRETDRRIYRDALAYAARTRDTKMAATLKRFGAPPYRDVFAYGYVMGLYDKLAGPYTAPAAYRQRGTASGIGPFGVLGSEYTLIDKVNVMRGLADTFATLYPQLQEIDFRRDVPRLAVPIHLLEGERELAGRRSLAVEWYRRVRAPGKQLSTFPNAGHAVAFEQYEALNRVMSTVLEDSQPLGGTK